MISGLYHNLYDLHELAHVCKPYDMHGQALILYVYPTAPADTFVGW